MKAKNISRYTYKKTAFQGWRLSIMRNGTQFTEYFSDKQYNNDYKESFHAAKSVRDEILDALRKCKGDDCKGLLKNYREQRAQLKTAGSAPAEDTTEAAE